MITIKTVLPFLLAALLLAAFLSPFASSLPDGLERVAEVLGFDESAIDKPIVTSPLPDYTVPALGDTSLSTLAAGVTGTLVCFFLPFTLYLLRKR